MLHSIRLPESGRAVGIGVDLVALDRFERDLAYSGSRFLARVFTRGEVGRCGGQASELAVVFATKEAVSKALGTGIRGVAWQDIDVRLDDGKQAAIKLRGRARQVAKAMSVSRWAVRAGTVDQYAVACAIALAHEVTQLSDGQRETCSDG